MSLSSPSPPPLQIKAPLEDDAPHKDLDAEQQESLLPDKDDIETGASRKKPKSGECSPWLTCLLSFAGLFLLALLAVSFKMSPRQENDKLKNNFRRPAADYVLHQDWDLHAPPRVREYHWTIQEIEANPDGVFRPMLTINGLFPGELIRCNEGDTIVVNVENKGSNATSIHWHGLFQNGTNWMDGTPGVTQCPIAPGRKFRYEFTVEGQAGTCKFTICYRY